ncbi:MAG: hypothetical protein ACM31C_16340 [Acidobacteriota bacterium]
MRALWLVVLAGCIIPEKHLAPNCGTASCGTSEVCDKTDPNGPTCIPAAGDLDGDGIPNDKDFCEHVAGGATDEDGDGIGDICDPCPIAPPPATPDPDGDAVDRPCDPDPHTAGDQILLFEGFASGIPSTWTPTTAGAWTAGTGEVKVVAGATSELLSTAVIAKANLAVEAAWQVDLVSPASTDHVVEVGASDPRPAGVASMSCGLERNDQTVAETVSLVTNQSSAMNVETVKLFDPAKTYQVGAYATGGQVACTAVEGGNAVDIVSAPITPDGMAAVSIGARAVSARFQWVLVVGRD